MPAILKEALEKIYSDNGFDLYFGGNPDDAQFSYFADLLKVLPDKSDCEISGDSLTLTEPQKREFARLSPGVAVVYQNGWTSSVLCKINLFKPEKVKLFVCKGMKVFKDLKLLTSQALDGFYKRSGKEYQEKISQLIHLEKIITQRDIKEWVELNSAR